ncbi:unnamed protein product [Thelazia callipaeda]|uniref:CD36 family protein n=1 Tax=Thelazia callipaeda TaxID=103827 RepID=A0A0N5D9H3_THECL|nr:unnamed protein product [Thelazia callipaeda]
MNMRILYIGALAIGAICIIIGVLSMTLIPLSITKRIEQDEHLGYDENGTFNAMTKRWIEPKYNMKIKVWVISVTNPEDVVNGSYPVVTEKGPYVYTEHQKKIKVKFMQNDTRVLYRNRRRYVYSEEESCANCSLLDSVMIPNLMFQARFVLVLQVASKSSPFVKNIIKSAFSRFKRETPFINATVGEVLFDGYEDPMIKWVCDKVRPLCSVANIPTRIRFLENDTVDGEYLIGTGLRSNQELGHVYAWNGQNETVWWSTAQARMINGTDGQLFPPSIQIYRDLPVFLGQLGRSIHMRYDKSVTYKGIPSYRFVIPSDVYDPFLPENKGFCNPEIPRYFSHDIQPDGCLPAGMFDIGHTKLGSPPIFMSGVHFYQSPAQVYQNFVGFPHPNCSDQSYIDIEPLTGVILNALGASQINVGMINDTFYFFQKIPSMIVPVLWLKEIINVDDDTRKELESVGRSSRMVIFKIRV